MQKVKCHFKSKQFNSEAHASRGRRTWGTVVVRSWYGHGTVMACAPREAALGAGPAALAPRARRARCASGPERAPILDMPEAADWSFP